MTALTLALVAGMAVTRDGQERISAETEQRLAIDGYWRGTLQRRGNFSGVLDILTFQMGVLPGRFMERPCQWIDEGQGKCQFIYEDCRVSLLGIYKQEAGQLFICLRQKGDGRPTLFLPTETDYLYTLHPTKPPKK